ncbi:hypothetical protein F4813DRAFT_342288 [Daldinia decipiens]|uniref:uncharacterized protein n=1 Tax=Daldinia decipiens TaxID=326647 RepID=UPI0020C50A69|nr:uncharacterized protein F4813DRAFT_342288 [Daldinia decipiens]KAI1662899.1 hypothetical protein F4813DRAFT_342288 [Daldinia decipiens]
MFHATSEFLLNGLLLPFGSMAYAVTVLLLNFLMEKRPVWEIHFQLIDAYTRTSVPISSNSRGLGAVQTSAVGHLEDNLAVTRWS